MMVFSDKKTIFSNFFSLSVLEISNYIFPLITLPYIVRILGPDYYGSLAISAAISNYLLIIVGYGYNIWATKEIAQNNTISSRNYIFSGVIYAKILLGILILSLSYLFLSLINIESSLKLLLSISFLLVIPNIFYPIWFFQGIQKMYYLTIFHFFLKLINLVLIFSVINEPKDYYMVPIFTLISSSIISLIALIMTYKNFNVKFVFLDINQVIQFITRPYKIFLNHFWDTFHTNLPVLTLSFFTGTSDVAYYSIAEKIVYALSNILKTFSRALFPLFASLVKKSSSHAKEIINKTGKYLFFILFFIVIIVSLFSFQIINLLFGDNYFGSVIILKVLIFFCMFSTLKQFIVTQGLINFDKFDEAAKVPFYGSLLSLCLVPLATFSFGTIGLSYMIVGIELLLLLIAIVYYVKNN